MEKNNSPNTNETNNDSLENKNNNNDKTENNDEIIVGGYGYWKRDGDLKDRDQFIPKQVEKLETLKVEDKKVSHGSAWNTAGTWEEKHYKKPQIEEYFNLNLKNKEFNGFIITRITNYSGDVRLLLN